MARIEVYLEVGSKRAFACSLDWPGWARSGKTEQDALGRLTEYGRRYAVVVEGAGLRLPATYDFEVVERLPGSSTTDFGAPDAIASADHQKLTAAQRAGWPISSKPAGRPSTGWPRNHRRNFARARAEEGGTGTRWCSTSSARRRRTHGKSTSATASRPLTTTMPWQHCGGTSPLRCGRREMRRRPGPTAGRRATPPAGSRGTSSITPGRWRTSATRRDG